jgi:hypothetical protein
VRGGGESVHMILMISRETTLECIQGLDWNLGGMLAQKGCNFPCFHNT